MFPDTTVNIVYRFRALHIQLGCLLSWCYRKNVYFMCRVSTHLTVACEACGASCLCSGAEYFGEGSDGVQSGKIILFSTCRVKNYSFLLSFYQIIVRHHCSDNVVCVVLFCFVFFPYSLLRYLIVCQHSSPNPPPQWQSKSLQLLVS